MEIRKITDKVSVSPQIGVDDIPAIKAAGLGSPGVGSAAAAGAAAACAGVACAVTNASI